MEELSPYTSAVLCSIRGSGCWRHGPSTAVLSVGLLEEVEVMSCGQLMRQLRMMRAVLLWGARHVVEHVGVARL